MIAIKLFVIVAFLVYAQATPTAHPQAASKYSVIDQNANYFEASLACKQGGQELVSIETLEEWQTIVELIEELGEDATTGNLLWTSGNSLQAPNSTNFYWQSDGSLIPKNAIYWAAGEPNSKGDEQCIIINKLESSGLLSINDYNCYLQGRYICESD